MKKRLSLLFISLATMACVGFGTVKYIEAKAEEEPAVEVAPSNEEEVDYKAMYEEVVAKINRIANTQILGTTIGALVAVLVSIGITALRNKVGSERMEKLYEVSRNAEEMFGKSNEIVNKAKIMHEEAIAKIEEFDVKAEKTIEELEIEKANLQKYIEDQKAAREEERMFFLSIISHSKEMVASGKAEELIKFFEDKK